MSDRTTVVMAAADQYLRACLARDVAVRAFSEASAAWSAAQSWLDEPKRLKLYEDFVAADTRAKDACRAVREADEALRNAARRAT